MYIFKNACKNITRSKGRNILIGIIIVVMSVATCVALSIRNSANEIVQTTKDSYDITANLGIDRQTLMQSAQSGSTPQDIMNSIPALDEESINLYGTSDYVKNYSYTLQSELNSSNITAVSNDTTDTGNDDAPSDSRGQSGMQQMPGGMVRGDFRVIGYSSQSSMANFVDGTYKITSGEIFEDGETSNVCVISDELAATNELTVGSTITLTNPQDETQTYDYKVVGIYTDNTETDTAATNWFSNSANQIITSYTSLNAIVAESKSNADTALNGQFSSSFILKNADVIDAFTAELTTKGLSIYYTVNTNIDAFESSVKPLTNLSNFATIFLLLVLAIGSIVIVVLNMINIRERKYEVGVLRAIGMKKSKVSMQFITELFLVTFVSIIIGTSIGAVASVPTASYMLQNEITAQEEAQAAQAENFGQRGGQGGGPGGGGMIIGGRGGMGNFFGGNQNVDYISQINAVINGEVLLQIALIGILLTLVASSISMVVISRYEPLKILSNRT